MILQVGNAFISLVGQYTSWLTGNIFGAYAMFCILMLFFSVIISLGGHNR